MSRVFGKQAFAETTTVDGVTLSYEGDLAVGTAVFIADEEGNQIAAPEGSHSLDDGRTITIDADGIVTEVTEAPEADEVTVEEVVEVMQAMAKELKAVRAEFEAFKKAQVPAKQKFVRKEGAKTWKDVAAAQAK